MVFSLNKLTNRQTHKHTRALAHTPLLTQRKSVREVPWESERKDRCPYVGTAPLRLCRLLQICPHPLPQMNESTTEKNRILWKQSLIFMRMIDCCHSTGDASARKPAALGLGAAQAGDALRVALLPQLLLLDGELLRLV